MILKSLSFRPAVAKLYRDFIAITLDQLSNSRSRTSSRQYSYWPACNLRGLIRDHVLHPGFFNEDPLWQHINIGGTDTMLARKFSNRNSLLSLGLDHLSESDELLSCPTDSL